MATDHTMTERPSDPSRADKVDVPTPRTDTLFANYAKKANHPGRYAGMLEHARQLERELAIADEACREYEQEREELRTRSAVERTVTPGAAYAWIAEAAAELKERMRFDQSDRADALLAGVPVPQEDLGFGSPADIAAALIVEAGKWKYRTDSQGLMEAGLLMERAADALMRTPRSASEASIIGVDLSSGVDRTAICCRNGAPCIDQEQCAEAGECLEAMNALRRPTDRKAHP